MTTYDPKSKTKYFVRQGEVEKWIKEQYDVPRFNIPADLEEFASPEGSYSLRVDGEVSDYHKEDLKEFFDEVEEEKEKDGYYSVDTRLLTEPLMNKLASEGHIPEGDYVIELSY